MTKAMISLISMATIPLAISAIALARQDAASSKQWAVYRGEPGVITTTLSADRATYYVGEPIRLTLVVRNESEEPLVGFFAAVSDSEVHYRRSGAAFSRFTGASKQEQAWAERRHGLRAPVRLDPGKERKAEFRLAMHGVGTVVLAEPGEYELKVISHPAPNKPDHALESNVVVLRVGPVPDSQREAFAEYSRNRLGAVVQSAEWVAEKDPATLGAAADFVDRFPHSAYAQEVREELVKALRVRVLQNRASKEQRGLYEKLKEPEPPGQ